MKVAVTLTTHAVSFKRSANSDWETGIRVKSSLGCNHSNMIVDYSCKEVVEVWDIIDEEYEGCFVLQTSTEVITASKPEETKL